MAYDGFTVAATVQELREAILDGSIAKIAQPEKDELLLTVKCSRKMKRLSLSASASMPLCCLKEENALSPVTAPNFCMTLRKHIGGGRIRRIWQPGHTLEEEGLERIIALEIEHLDEMGDLGSYRLVCELMGKYSNLILLREDGTIIDSIKHIPPSVSSVREVLPGRSYFIPDNQGKKNPRKLAEIGVGAFRDAISEQVLPLQKAIYGHITGFSPIMAEELCTRAGLSSEQTTDGLDDAAYEQLYQRFCELMGQVAAGAFSPNIVYEGERPAECAALPLRCLEGGDYAREDFSSMSAALLAYYSGRAKQNRIRAKSEDIRHLLKLLTERAAKKLELQEQQYRDADKKDKYRVYGELLNSFGYGLNGGETELRCNNYYDNDREIRIPLDKDLDARANAARYFERYQKLKRTQEALLPQIEAGRQTLYHLDSLTTALGMAETEADLNQLRQEMREYGFLQKKAGERRLRKEELRSEPMHFVSSDGIDLYVGRNNYQNEELTFRQAEGSDWWFHAKKVAGSHVIAKTGTRELPDKTCLEAAALAAYYSKACIDDGRDLHQKIEVDYVQKKALKRVPGAAPGYVIYHTNYSIMIEPRPDV